MGGALAAVGVGVAVLLVVTGVLQFVDRIDDFQRVPLGREGTVVFERAGGYTLYYEPRFSSDRAVPDFDVSLVPADGGDRIPLADYG